MSDKNEIEVWRDAADSRARQELLDAETRHCVATNAVEIVEQRQIETHRAHQRKLELQRLANEHEIAKMETIDMKVEVESRIALERYQAATALQKGWLKGLAWGTPIGWLVGFGSGLAIGFLF